MLKSSDSSNSTLEVVIDTIGPGMFATLLFMVGLFSNYLAKMMPDSLANLVENNVYVRYTFTGILMYVAVIYTTMAGDLKNKNETQAWLTVVQHVVGALIYVFVGLFTLYIARANDHMWFLPVVIAVSLIAATINNMRTEIESADSTDGSTGDVALMWSETTCYIILAIAVVVQTGFVLASSS